METCVTAALQRSSLQILLSVNTQERLHHPVGSTNHKISHYFKSLIHITHVPYSCTLQPEPEEVTCRTGPGKKLFSADLRLVKFNVL